MILKKPYAFLIKNFRIIHLLLTFFIIYISFKSYNIYNFFRRYADNVISILADAKPSNYITIPMFLITIAIITFSLAMYFLMRKKEKPKKLYMSLSIYYTLYLFGITIYFMVFKSIEITQLTIKNSMILRDLTMIISLPQIVFLILSLIRAVGFDIKSFNFSKDLKELDINKEDNEEFEFILGVDSYKYFRMLRRKIREFKYYILENKFMFTILASLTACIFIILIILNFTVYNRTYNKNQKFIANKLGIKINNSYITNMDYRGKIINDEKYYLIVNTTFYNNSGESTVLELNNYRLKTKKGYVYPTLSKNNYFVDLGSGYSKEKIENNKTITYILVYELSEKQKSSKYTLEILDEVDFKSGTINSKIKKISLKPEEYFESKNVGEFNLNKPINLYDSILEDSSLIINSFEFKNKFIYEYEACIRYDCNDVVDVVIADIAKDKILLILNGKLSMDKNSAFIHNIKTKLSFFDAFVQIKYDNKITNVINDTPTSLTDKYILQVDKDVSKAKTIDIIITIRNRRYTLKLR